ncbi:MAG: ABC transporter permease [Bacilli bacterium]|nr:ABC transporter permease [Bacilli bacterium]
MRNVLTIFLKELKRVFTDRRMLISLFLPGVLIYFVYTLMGTVMTKVVTQSSTKDTTFQVAYTNNFNSSKTDGQLPKLMTYVEATIKGGTNNNKVEFKEFTTGELDSYKEELRAGKYHLVVSFTDDFENKLADNAASNNVDIFYNGDSSASSDLYNFVSQVVGVSYTNYTVNLNGQVAANVGDKDMMAMKIAAMIIPMVTISILFSTVLSLCPEAIAGEKERGTLASLLLTPIKRSEFVAGKILSLSTTAIASGIVSFTGLILSIPKLMGGFNITISPVDGLLLFLLVVAVLLLFVAIGVFISALANTVKEAAGYLSPIMIVFMLFGMAPSLFGFDQWYLSFVPILNVCVSINALLNGAENLLLFFGLTVASTVLYTGLLMFAVTKLFNKERVVLGQ